MSVNWSTLSSVEDTLKGYRGYGVVSITAGLCWNLEQQIEYQPIKDHPDLEDNTAHCEVVGKKTTRVRNGFKTGSRWLERPSRP
jgi:hypothetical protein